MFFFFLNYFSFSLIYHREAHSGLTSETCYCSATFSTAAFSMIKIDQLLLIMACLRTFRSSFSKFSRGIAWNASKCGGFFFLFRE